MIAWKISPDVMPRLAMPIPLPSPSLYLCSLQRESMCMYVLVSTLSCTNIISYATRRPVPAFANAHACPFWHCALFQPPSADLVTGDLPHFEPGR